MTFLCTFPAASQKSKMSNDSSSYAVTLKRGTAVIMVSPPSQWFWVGMLAVLLVVELPGVLPKCIFDEVQAEARVVRAAPGEPRPGARAAPASPQPIRIQTWIPVEGGGLSEAEKEKLEAAVEQAVRMVSSLLSGEAHAFTRCLFWGSSIDLHSFPQGSDV